MIGIRLILLFITTVFVGSLQAQHLIPAGHYGYLAAHRQHMTHLVHTRTWGGSLSLEKRASGERKWHRDYNLPHYGITASVIDWGNRNRLGFGIGVYPYIKFDIIDRAFINLRFKTGGGPGYVTGVWDPVDNHKNTVFGSPYVITVHMSMPLTVSPTPNLNFYIAPALTHMSNGATRLPNSGGNYLALEFGVFHSSSRSEPEMPEGDDPKNRFEKPDFGVLTAGNAFFKEGLYELTGIRPVATLSAEAFWRPAIKSSFHLGADAMYNGSLAVVYSEITDEHISTIEQMQYGIAAGYHLTFSSWEIYVKQGVYLHSKFYPEGRLYHRFGVRGNFTENWFFNTGIKSHFFVADYFEFGLGRILWTR